MITTNTCASLSRASAVAVYARPTVVTTDKGHRSGIVQHAAPLVGAHDRQVLDVLCEEPLRQLCHHQRRQHRAPTPCRSSIQQKKPLHCQSVCINIKKKKREREEKKFFSFDHVCNFHCKPFFISFFISFSFFFLSFHSFLSG